MRPSLSEATAQSRCEVRQPWAGLSVLATKVFGTGTLLSLCSQPSLKMTRDQSVVRMRAVWPGTAWPALITLTVLAAPASKVG